MHEQGEGSSLCAATGNCGSQRLEHSHSSTTDLGLSQLKLDLDFELEVDRPVSAPSPIAPLNVPKSNLIRANRATRKPATGKETHHQHSKEGEIKKMVGCKFFFSGRGCSAGNSCKFSHEIDQAEPSRAIPATDGGATKSTGSAAGNRPLCKFFAGGYCKLGNRCGFFHSVPVSRPQGFEKDHHQVKKLSTLSDHELKAIRKSEIFQLKRRYPKRLDVDASTYRFIFRPTDPDWPFDVKTVNLEISFPDLYPKHIMSAGVYDEESLPQTLARHICKKMNDWITDRHEACLKAEKVELVFRPFLRWLDKTIEQIFTEGLTMFKRELSAKAAGFTFVHHSAMIPDADKSDSAETNDTSDAGRDVGQSLLRQQTQELGHDVDQSTLGQRIQELECASTTDSTQKHDGISKMENCGSASATDVSSQQTMNSKLNPARRGTELRFRNLRLQGSAATLHCTILRIGIRCSRCKTVHHVSMHPERPYVIVCGKCRSKMSLIFHANLMHSASSTIGFFDLDACVPIDLVLQDCQLVVGCLDCGKELLVHGLHSEQEKQFWCISCHRKMAISAERGTFILLNGGAAIKIGADAVLIAKKAKAKSELRIFAEGKPLPDKGTCLHYKKSYRWFRFPCCGKLYPCDKCHEEKETDHELEMANRMVCGFCSKEQGFSLVKPCIGCDSSLTRSKSQHWEGGQGCRNKIAMAKGDKHKFVGSSKTVSKKSEAAQKKSGKKTTHVRHTV